MGFRLSPNSLHVQTESSVPISPALPPKKTAEELKKENAALRKAVGKTLEFNHKNFLEMTTKILQEEFKVPPEKITPEAKIFEDLGLQRAKLRSFLLFLKIEFNREFTVPKSGTLSGFLR
ncbi:hypothetical protein K9N08_01075 [Candidatus Gracilibacteria bacterium]|nr:hypothetical protein [Candidatus Gracilibacteria bacterium]MCF7856135.1 hypothetical protein [Candidatus Gracilibacteria bacterium]MCF7896601.1 hypothetical protein [Candidatus Gracilibacteria bacterium]